MLLFPANANPSISFTSYKPSCSEKTITFQEAIVSEVSWHLGLLKKQN